MNTDYGDIFESLYGGAAQPATLCGSVLVTLSASLSSSSKIYARLAEDLSEVLTKSGFRIANPGKNDNLLVEIVVGPVPARSSSRKLYLDVSGWEFRISDVPLQFKGTPKFNPLTSLFAAAALSSQVFRLRFGNELGWARDALSIDVNLLGSDDLDGSFPETIDLGSEPVSWFGCGSIAHAACFALRGIRITQGLFHIVDSDLLKPKSVRKYLGVSKKDSGQLKAESIRQRLELLGAKAKTFDCSLNEYSRQVSFQIPLAIASTDTSLSRRDAQAKLPRSVINCWTGNDPKMLQAGMYSYKMSSGAGCLVCQYWRDVEGHPDLVSIGQKSGVSPSRFRASIRENNPIGEERLPENVIGSKFSEGYKAMCDTFQIQTGNLRREFGIPFLASAAAVLLDLALISEKSKIFGEAKPPHSLFRLAVSPPATTFFLDAPIRRAGCICSDADYISAYTKKWS